MNNAAKGIIENDVEKAELEELLDVMKKVSEQLEHLIEILE